MANLRLADDGGLRRADGTEFRMPCPVFKITCIPSRDDLGGVPELFAAYQEVPSAIECGEQNGAKCAQDEFRLGAVVCPDFQPEDGARLTNLVKD